MTTKEAQNFIERHTENPYYTQAYLAMENSYLPDLCDHIALTCGKPCRVLDIGPGWGTLAVWLASRGHDVTLMDLMPFGHYISAEKLRAIERATGHPVRYQQHSILHSPLESQFDLIVMSQVLPHLKHRPDRAIHNVAQMLVPGGLFLCVVLDKLRHPNVPARYDRWEDLPAVGTGPGVPEMVTCMYDEKSLACLMVAGGFSKVSVAPLGAYSLIAECRP